MKYSSVLSVFQFLLYVNKSGEDRVGGAMMSEPVCKGEHSGHLCVLASCGNFDQIKELTKNPKYICFNCGRVANSDEHLCNPMPNE
jgi:hypothetical protein